MKREQKSKNQPIFTVVSFVLIICAIGVMTYIYIRHHIDEPEWANFALMMIGFASIGLVGSLFISQTGLAFAKFNINTGIRALILLLVCMITQIITQTALTIPTVDRALYYVFGAVCEEVFFRVFILNLFTKIPLIDKKQVWIPLTVGILIQALIFTVLHINYYNNIAMLLSVFIGGLLLGIGYVIWRDSTANILAHFLLNLIAVQSLLINL